MNYKQISKENNRSSATEKASQNRMHQHQAKQGITLSHIPMDAVRHLATAKVPRAESTSRLPQPGECLNGRKSGSFLACVALSSSPKLVMAALCLAAFLVSVLL
jgi:hypothetical protein